MVRHFSQCDKKCDAYIRNELYAMSCCQVARPRFKGFQACFEVSPRRSCLRSTSLFLQRVIINISVSDHMKKLKNVSLVGNTGHFHNEIDFAGSEVLDGVKVINTRLFLDGATQLTIGRHNGRPMHSIRSLSSVCPVTAARRRFNRTLHTDVSVVIRRTHHGFRVRTKRRVNSRRETFSRRPR